MSGVCLCQACGCIHRSATTTTSLLTRPPCFFYHHHLPSLHSPTPKTNSGAWVLLYAVEAAAIMSLINRNPDKTNSSQALPADLSSALSALPSRSMFPSSLTPVKDALAHTLAAGATAVGANSSSPLSSTDAVVASTAAAIAATTAAAAAAPSAITAAPPGLSKELEKTLDDIERAAAAGGRDTSSSSVSTPTIEAPKSPEKVCACGWVGWVGGLSRMSSVCVGGKSPMLACEAGLRLYVCW